MTQIAAKEEKSRKTSDVPAIEFSHFSFRYRSQKEPSLRDINLKIMGFFYWALGILNVTRMVTQAIGYAGRAMISGVIEMLARSAVAMIFVPMFGYQAICWTDQAAWLTATLYITPVCYFSLRQAEKKRRI